ncbi:glycosyltransferase [Nesterenkonia pannonica]|uniref:glycosyltransferase family 2 protein n=1 Tax=Nesterenkonia pannonica TaxID=1548602 RepID=UPI0021649D33|nr:glycosyltransferase family 2 protein [Nesterenkonia pannonica]
MQPDDLAFATRALELVTPELVRLGEARRYNKLLADLYFEQQRFSDLESLANSRGDIKTHFFSYLPTDARSPFVRDDLGPGAYDNWLERFNRQFTRNDLLPVRLEAGEQVPFNRLTAPPVQGPQPEGPLVTVIMTSFKPPREDILQSARSILAQSWRNLELLIVDDASPEEYGPVLDELEALDPRLQVLRLDTNGGTYVARNVGIARARGEFVTGQDADDWSHPQRLETQVNHLLRNPRRPGNQVYTVNMTEDLVRVRRGYTPSYRARRLSWFEPGSCGKWAATSRLVRLPTTNCATGFRHTAAARSTPSKNP